MKRKGNIIISTVLSLMLVYLGAGVVLMHCCHTERTTFVGVADCCKDDCDGSGKKCMKFEMRKLPPSVVSDYESAPLPLLKAISIRKIFIFKYWNYPVSLSYLNLTVNRIDGFLPRSYLSLLTVLII